MGKYYEYVTRQGDTFDSIALGFYMDEKRSSEVINKNPDYADVIIFDAGITLKVPLLEESSATTMPPWKR